MDLHDPKSALHAYLQFYRRVWTHADATIDELALDATGAVPWWTAYRDRLEQVAQQAAERV